MKIKFYLTPNGRSPVEEFLKDLPESTRLEIFDALTLLETGRSLEMPLSKNLSSIRSGLHELRVRDKAGQVRVITSLSAVIPSISFMDTGRRLKLFRRAIWK